MLARSDKDLTVAATEIEQSIKNRIRTGTYSPGQRLIEVDLATQFDTGRGRIREAFKSLIGEGYLVLEENRGVYVRRFSRAEILEMGRVREVLEGLTARLAAEAELSDSDRAALTQHQSVMDAAVERRDVAAFNAENFAYHDTICRLGGNGHAMRFLGHVRLPLYRLQLPMTFSLTSMDGSNRDHRVITAAILSGNGDAAEAAMRAHVRAGNAHVANMSADHFA